MISWLKAGKAARYGVSAKLGATGRSASPPTGAAARCLRGVAKGAAVRVKVFGLRKDGAPGPRARWCCGRVPTRGRRGARSRIGAAENGANGVFS